MTTLGVSNRQQHDLQLGGDRRRLVALCSTLTGNSAAAEDLAQETLVEAWRHRDRIYDPTGLSSWISAIAHNVCRRWMRDQARQRMWSAGTSSLPDSPFSAHDPVDPACNLEVELERRELAELLERAMNGLTPQARAVLIQRYVEDLPHAEIATRLGLTEGAVRISLHRGKLAMKRILTTKFRDDAVAHGLIEPETAGWQETRIWCPLCGKRRFMGRLDTREGAFELRCPDCYEGTGTYTEYTSTLLFTGVSGYKTAFNRVMRFVNPFHERALVDRSVCCPSCTRGDATLHLHLPLQRLPEGYSARGLHVRCSMCGAAMSMRLSNLALYQPAAWDFWRAHPRIRLLPERVVDAGSRQTVVLSYESTQGQARLDVLVAADTYEVMGIHQTPGS